MGLSQKCDALNALSVALYKSLPKFEERLAAFDADELSNPGVQDAIDLVAQHAETLLSHVAFVRSASVG